MAFIGLLICPSLTRAETSPPPMAEAANVSVQRQGEVEIPLRASGRTPGKIRFLIRRPPGGGQLGEIRLTSEKTAVVTYRHTGTEDFDVFRYAVQAVDSPVSASAEIRISVLDPPAVIEGPPRVDFGETGIGSRASQRIELSNKGGRPAVIRPRVEPPWHLASQPETTIFPGTSAQITIDFLPGRAGSFEGRLVLPGFSDVVVQLEGWGVELLEISPEEELRADDSERRFPEVSLKNPTSSDQTVEFQVPAHVDPMKPVSLAPGESVPIRPVISGGWRGPVDGDLVLRVRDTRRTLPLRANASPPELAITPNKNIDFGKIPAGSRTEKIIEITNTGGTPAMLEAQLSEGLVVIPSPDSVVIPPGAKRDFTIALETLKEGQFAGEAVFLPSDGEPLRLAVRAEVLGQVPPTGEATLRTGDLIPTEIAESSDPGEDSAVWIPEEGFHLVSQQTGTVEIAWKEDTPAPAKYLVERREVRFAGDDLPPEIIWHPIETVRFHHEADRIVAGILRLPPDSAWTIRLIPVASDGNRTSPSPPLRIASPPLPTAPWFLWLVPAAVLLAGGYFLARKLLQIRSETDAAERGRISRLERGD